MKKTRTLKNLLLKAIFAYLLLAVTSTYGQRAYTFEVNSPAGIAGSYDVVHAQFGPFCGIDAATGDFVIADDGSANPTQACDPIQNDLTGAVALIDRGSCNFSIKCYNAQQAGAVAVVVCNNNTDDIFAMAAGTNSDLVTIPSVMMSMADCSTIRAQIPTVNVTVAPVVEMAPPSTDVIYYEEDFNAGPNGWTSTTSNDPDEVFFWSDNGIFPTFGGGNVGISLPGSSCTGAMGFPSGWYQGNMTGVADSVPPQPYTDYDAQLVSPVLDLSGITDAISLTFNQRVLRLNPNSADPFTSVAYSLDGGDTWSDPIAVNADVPTNSADEPSPAVINTVNVGIPDIQGEPNVRIRFEWRLDFYYWIIDDVKLIRRSNNDLVLENFYAIAPNVSWPLSQVEPYSHLADVTNFGVADQPNTTLNITITDDSGTPVYTEDLDYGTTLSDSLYQNEPFAGFFTPTTTGLHTGTYTLSSDSTDFDPSNNTQTYQFTVTDTLFAKETGATRLVGPALTEWGDMEPHSWAYGNYFHMPNGSGQNARYVTFAVGNGADAVGGFLTLSLYKWEDDGTAPLLVSPAERGLPIATALYVVDGTEVNTDVITLPLKPAGSDDVGPIPLEDDSHYIIMLEYQTSNQVDFLTTASEALDYGAQVLRADSAMIPRYAGVLGIGGTLTDIDYSTVGFGRDIVPVVRLSIGEPLEPMTIAVEDILSDDNKIVVSPNPAESFINLSLDLVEAHDNAVVKIMDSTGKLLSESRYDNIQKESLRYDISNYAAGTYFLHFVSEVGNRVVPFIVTK